jgi:hypothetical protein
VVSPLFLPGFPVNFALAAAWALYPEVFIHAGIFIGPNQELRRIIHYAFLVSFY